MSKDKAQKKIGAATISGRILPRSVPSEAEGNSSELNSLYNKSDDLKPGYWYAKPSAVYLNTTTRKIALYRKYRLLKYAKFGKNYVYKKEWLDDFAEEWAGYDLGNEAKVKRAVAEKAWRKKNHMEYGTGERR